MKITTLSILCAAACLAQHPGSPGIPSPGAQDFNNAFRNHPGSQSGMHYQIRKAQFQAQQMAYDAVLEKSIVPKGEAVILNVRYKNCQPETPPELPQIDGLQIEYAGEGEQSSYHFGGGQGISTRLITHRFIVKSEREGDFEIPPIESIIMGKSYKTNPLRLKVSKGVDYSQYAFVKLRHSKPSVYVGEVFPLFVDVFDKGDRMDQCDFPSIPAEGFIINNIRSPAQSRMSRGNTSQLSFGYLVRAIKTGELEIGPANVKVSLRFQNRSRRGLFGLFDNSIRREVILNSEPLSIKVKPLPDDKPEGFDAAVGNFRMRFSASPTELSVGDPITLTLKISGRGALETLKMPSLESWEDFKQYQETARIDYSDEVGLMGTKTFEKVIIPNHAEIYELPEIAFSFFDPLEEDYKTLRQAATPIIVKPNLRSKSDPTMIAESPSMPLNLSTNLIHIKPRLGHLSVARVTWLSQAWFLWLHCVPIFIWVFVFALGFLREAEARNPRAKRRKAVRKTTSKGLDQLARFASANQSEAFFALLFRLLQEQIGERLDLPASAITEAAIEGELQNRLSNQNLKMLERLFQTCNQSRYAPMGSTEELSQIAHEARLMIEALRSLPDR